MGFLKPFEERIYAAARINFVAHQANGAIPILNQGELAVLYCWMFLWIAVRGAGIWSVDAARESSA